MRGNPSLKNISLIFTGDEYRDGLSTISKVLGEKNVKGAFFVTGKFLEDEYSKRLLKKLYKKGHYVGPHSDQHLLYAPWDDRDSLLVTKEQFCEDLEDNIKKLEQIGIPNGEIFVPPYEWYNKEIVNWANQLGFKVYNFTPGLRTAADYTYPEMDNKYMSSDKILNQLYDYEKLNGINGHIILVHIGTDSRRTDKLYNRLGQLIEELQSKNYIFVPLENL